MDKGGQAMSAKDQLKMVLACLGPASLRARVNAIADGQPADQRDSVNLSAIMDALAVGRDLGTGSEGWAAQLALKRAIIDLLGQIPDMQFVAGDA